ADHVELALGQKEGAGAEDGSVRARALGGIEVVQTREDGAVTELAGGGDGDELAAVAAAAARVGDRQARRAARGGDGGATDAHRAGGPVDGGDARAVAVAGDERDRAGGAERRGAGVDGAGDAGAPAAGARPCFEALDGELRLLGAQRVELAAID